MTFIISTILAIALALSVGCTGTGPTKPLTPTEVQLISVVIAKRVIADSLTADQTKRVILGISAARVALANNSALDVLMRLEEFLGPENADIAALIVALVQVRVDVAQLPEMEGKAYVFGVLAGVERGLTPVKP